MAETTIVAGNCLNTLDELKEQSVNTVVTSPPYWGLRDYQTGTWEGGDPDCPHMRTTKISKDTATGHKAMYDQGSVVGDAIYKSTCPQCGATRIDEQIGLEETPEAYTSHLVEVFRKIKRVLRDDGTVWLNLGDSYCGTGHKGDYKDPKHEEGRNGQVFAINNTIAGLKSKDLVGIPWRVAFALQADGWYLRQDIIWHKPNPMPESVQDRCTKAHEYIFLLSKNQKYYYDVEAVKEEAVGERWGGNKPIDMNNTKDIDNQFNGLTRKRKMVYDKRNKRSVWTVNLKPFKQAHFATYPPDLIEPCILAGCPKGGTVLDPFGGAGTTALVANRNDRNAVILELNDDYATIAKERLADEFGMFATIHEKL
jgi:DNA modification methylase